jgi:three-Cys-motif partner protein
MPERKMSEVDVRRWGGRHTSVKAEVVRDYVLRYGTVMKNQTFTTAYIDAFAGSGWRDVGDGTIEHSVAVQVLDPKDPLDRYVFGDKSAALSSLRSTIEGEFGVDHWKRVPHPEYWPGDANELIARECQWINGDRLRRAIMFLDPFGMQVKRTSLEMIAATRRVDLWVLVPINQALSRLLQRDGDIPSGRQAALDDFLGQGWRERFYAPVPDLLGTTRARRADDNEICNFVRETLMSIAGPGTHPTGLKLYRNNQLAFWLGFACTNEAPQAYSLALKLADHLIRQAQKPQ